MPLLKRLAARFFGTATRCVRNTARPGCMVRLTASAAGTWREWYGYKEGKLEGLEEGRQSC
jgi:hypothetical protein